MYVKGFVEEKSNLLLTVLPNLIMNLSRLATLNYMFKELIKKKMLSFDFTINLFSDFAVALRYLFENHINKWPLQC